jgi:toxin FitB
VDVIAELYRILPVDGRAFRIWARLMHHQPADLGLDALIAPPRSSTTSPSSRATCKIQRFGVAILDPWKISAQ